MLANERFFFLLHNLNFCECCSKNNACKLFFGVGQKNLLPPAGAEC